MYIRKSKKRDCSQVLRIAKQFSKQINLRDKQARLEEAIGTTKVIVACTEQGKVASFIYAYMKGKGQHLYAQGNNHLYVSAICTDKKHAKKGYASTLVRELTSSNAHRTIKCSIDIENCLTAQMLTKAGYQITTSNSIFTHAKQEHLLPKMSQHLRPFQVEANTSDAWGHTLNTLVNVIEELNIEGRTNEAQDLQGIQDYIGGMLAITGSTKTSTTSLDMHIPTKEGEDSTPLATSVNDNDTLPTLSVGGGREEIPSTLEPVPIEEVEDILPGGLADNLTDDTFIAEQVAKGIEVELEHTDSIEVAKDIAKDHLVENPKYYNHLEEMEDSMNTDTDIETVEERIAQKLAKLDKKADYTQYPNEDSVYPELVEEGNLATLKSKVQELWESIKQEGSDTLKLFSPQQAATVSNSMFTNSGKKIATSLNEDDKKVLKSFWDKLGDLAYSITGQTVEEVLKTLTTGIGTVDDTSKEASLQASLQAGLSDDNPDYTGTISEEADRKNTVPVKSPGITRIDGQEDEINVQTFVPQNVHQLEQGQEVVTDFANPTTDTVENTPEATDHKHVGDVENVDSIVHTNEEYPVPKNPFEQKEMETYNEEEEEEVDKYKKLREQKDKIDSGVPNKDQATTYNDGTTHHGSVTKRAAQYCEECDEMYVDENNTKMCPKCLQPTRDLQVEDVQRQNNKLREQLGREAVPVTGTKSTKTSKSVTTATKQEFDFTGGDEVVVTGTNAFTTVSKLDPEDLEELNKIPQDQLTLWQYNDLLTEMILDNKYQIASENVITLAERSNKAHRDGISVTDFYNELLNYGLLVKKASYTEKDIKEVIVESEARKLFSDDETDQKKRDMAIEFLEDTDENNKINGISLVDQAVFANIQRWANRDEYFPGETQADILRRKMSQVGMGK